MATKTVKNWAAYVQKIGFDGISKDNTLRNAVSKSLAKAFSKDQFNFLIDRGDVGKKYLVYVKKSNDLNLPSTLLDQLKEAKDEKELKKIMDGSVTTMVKDLFNTNVGSSVRTHAPFIEWAEQQNKADVAKIVAKLVKDLGIKDKAGLTEAVTEEAKGDEFCAEAKKIAAKLEKAEKKTGLYAAIQKAV